MTRSPSSSSSPSPPDSDSIVPSGAARPEAGLAALEGLRERVATELAQPVRPAVSWLADQICAKYGHAVLGVLFYGSCLRKQSDEGVLDFWVVVEDYAAAYRELGRRGKAYAVLNHLAPPNVYYLELEYPSDGQFQTLRTKYGVISRRDFERNTSLSARHPYAWARFAQPARLIICRDEDSREALTRAVSEAIVTMVGRLVCFLPIHGGQIRFRVAAFWQLAFRLTYDSERRPESEESIRSLYLADEERYDTVAMLAVQILAARGHFDHATPHPRAIGIDLSARKRGLQRIRWRSMRPYSRTLGLIRLIKTAWTFGDWVPYALWKLERHTGRPLEISERQRRHPFVFGWPIILPLIFKRNLR